MSEAPAEAATLRVVAGSSGRDAGSEAAGKIMELLDAVAAATARLVAPIRAADWSGSHYPVMGPVAWDVGHVIQQEDLWLAQVLGGLEEARPGLNRVYDAYENPRSTRAGLPLLDQDEAARLRVEVRERVVAVLESASRAANRALWHDLFVHKMVVLHEAQHQETILQHLALYPPGHYVTPPRAPSPERGPVRQNRFAWHPGGRVPLGVPMQTGWTYDNEWPVTEVDVAPFWLQCTPLTNGQFLRFMAAGGYEDERYWSPDGWRYAREEGWQAPLHWVAREGAWYRRSYDVLLPVDPEEPVMHVSWFEADACARFYACRLPSEAEWESAATFDHTTAAKRYWPWGNDEPSAAHANLDQARWSPDAVGTHPAGSSPLGVEQLIGDVWEWTSSHFLPYPGFVAFPYRDYSERFFGAEHRVLRGGSWATRSLLRLGSFRNWDLPQRRQVFAGFRLAANVLPDWAEAEAEPCRS